MDWQTITIGVLAVAALPYVLGPVLVGATMRFGVNPKLEEVNPATASVPARVAAHLRESAAALGAAGFEMGPILRIEGISTGAWMYAAMARRTDGDLAMAAAVMRRVKGVDTPGTMYVEFAADFADGTGVCTNNSREPPLGPRSDRVICLRFPRVKDVGRLLEVHREGVRRFGRGSRKPGPRGDWWTPALLESLRKFADHMVASGWFARGADGGYRMTLKGAVLGTWSNLPPWLWVRRGAMGHRERQVAHIVGV